jgi:uroporphyrinogen-III synthase
VALLQHSRRRAGSFHRMQQKTVAILESRLGEQLAELVGKRGGRPFRAPALAEIPDVDPAYIGKLVRDLETRPAKAAIFQTGVGTHALFRATDALGLTAKFLAMLANAVVVVRGPKPTGALRSRNVRIDLSAAEPYTTAEVLDVLREVQIQGERVIVQRYGAPNPELDQALKARGAHVLEVPVYRWSLPADTQPLVDLMDALARGEIHAATFTSASQVHNLFALAEQLGRSDPLRADLNRVLIASIGPVCTVALKQHGVAVGLEPRPPKLGPLVAALDRALSA